MKTSTRSNASSSTTLFEPPARHCLCPHQHFRAPLIDRNQLNSEEHIALLATPRGYRWNGSFPPNYNGPKAFSLLKPTRKKNQEDQKCLEEAERRYMQQFVSQIFPLMSKEMLVRLKRMLVVEFGMTPKKAGEFIKSQNSAPKKNKKNKSNKCLEIDSNVKAHWLKEFERLLKAKMTDYLISIMCARRSKKVETIAKNILSQICDITGEWCSLHEPQNQVQRIQVFLAERFAVWLANQLEKADDRICKEYTKWPTGGSGDNRRSSISSAKLAESESSVGGKQPKELEEKPKDVEEPKVKEDEDKPKEEEEQPKEEEEELKKDEEEKPKEEEEEPKEAEEKAKEEEEKPKEEEVKPKEEEEQPKEEELKPKKEEEKPKEEDVKPKEEEEKPKVEEEKPKEEEEKPKEEEVKPKEEEEKPKEEEEKPKEEEKKPKEEEVEPKEEVEKPKEEEEKPIEGEKPKEEDDKQNELEEQKKKDEVDAKAEEEETEEHLEHDLTEEEGEIDESGAGDVAGRDEIEHIKEGGEETQPDSIDKQKDVSKITQDETKKSMGDTISLKEKHGQIMEEDLDELPAPKPVKKKEAYRVKKNKEGCFYEVKKIEQKEICDRTKIARKKRITMAPASVCERPITSKSIKASTDMKKWSRWATDVVNFVEKWSDWITNTTKEVEAQTEDQQQKDHEKYRKLKEKTEMGALELKRNKKYIKESSKSWKKKLNHEM